MSVRWRGASCAAPARLRPRQDIDLSVSAQLRALLSQSLWTEETIPKPGRGGPAPATGTRLDLDKPEATSRPHTQTLALGDARAS